MAKHIAIVGAGINGLVAANYLQKAGYQVTILERKPKVGGACTFATREAGGKTYTYPQGASVLGFMEDFVFEETGLSKRISLHSPAHPEIVYMGEDSTPVFISTNPEQLKNETLSKWNEQGDIAGFLRDMQKVVTFLRQGYREAQVPTLQSALKALGEELTALWISDSAHNLLNHYLTSEPLKVFYALSVIESGPVSYKSPYSAFSIPLMASGSVFGGEWGYVQGGIWQVPLELDRLNAGIGVERVLNAKVTAFDHDAMRLRYEQDGKEKTLMADYVLLATDPLTAARIVHEPAILKKLSGEKLIGTSGKLVLIFKNPVKWKDQTGMSDFDSAFRYLIPPDTLEGSEKLANDVVDGSPDFAPGLFEIYPEGAGDRKLGGVRDYELVSVFFKNLAFSKHGAELKSVEQRVTAMILSKIENKEDLITSILETPKDLADLFFFPKGNIDDVELAEGQTFFQRNYSPNPNKSFYQFGSNPRVFYCAAGAYPCGSVAGTPGYMCAKQIIKNHSDQ